MSTIKTNKIENVAGTVSVDVASLGSFDTSEWDGVAYNDSLAIGANATAKIYPDGSIVGSTDNGSYTRYPNGDLELRWQDSSVEVASSASGAMFRHSGKLMVFPIEMSSNSYVISGAGQSNNGYHSQPLFYNYTVSGCSGLFLGTENTSSIYYGYLANGRWK